VRYWLRRLEVVDKLRRQAVATLLLVRKLLPDAAPTCPPAIVDATAQASKSATNDTIEPPVADEIPVGNGLGVNRIASLVPRAGNGQRFAGDDLAVAPPKHNGFHHRLEELLPRGS
jgi:hypothetical protein